MLSSKNIEKIFIYMYFFAIDMKIAFPSFNFLSASSTHTILDIPLSHKVTDICATVSLITLFAFTFKLALGGTLTLVVVVSSLPVPLLCRILRELC